MRTHRRFGLAESSEDAERVAALEAQLAHLQGQFAELAERVDFAERLLAQQRDAARLAPPPT